jgi:hypothetical protein
MCSSAAQRCSGVKEPDFRAHRLGGASIVFEVYTLMRDVLRATGLKTKREAVEAGLRTLLRLKRQEQIRSFRGKLAWKGDLEQMRNDR